MKKQQSLTFKVEVSTNNRVQTYDIVKSEFVFGRSGKADICVDDNGISREHLRVKFENNTIFLYDNNSLNGVFVDGQKIKAGHYSPVNEDSWITFGKSQIKINVKLDASKKFQAAKADDLQSTLVKEDFTPPVLDETPISEPAEEFEIVPSAAASAPAPTAPPAVAATVQAEPVQATAATASATAATPAPKKNPRVMYHPVPAQPEAAIPEVKKEPTEEEKKMAADVARFVDLSMFPKSEEEARVNFKNVGLDLPKYKNPGAHAKEIIKEAEYQKHAIIKSAEVFKSKTLNETRILAKKAAEEAHAEFKKLADLLLETTRQELKKLRTDTDIMLDEKRIQANEEIQQLWQEHEEQIRADKQKQFDSFEKENKIKLDLSIEKARSDMFSERHKLLTEAENEILLKRRTYQVEFENERNEHLIKIKTYTDELTRTQTAIEEHKKVYKDSKQAREDAEIELSKIQSLLKSEKENLSIVVESFKETIENHKKIESDLAGFNENKQRLLTEIQKTEEILEKLNNNYAKLVEKKALTDEELKQVQQSLADAKAQAKNEVEREYAQLKETEAKKFEDYRANELKELQKIRDAHSESIKNFSVDLSQEIATKLELLAAQSGYSKFNFEKHFELINSVIQIKSSINTGSESKHAQQLDSWKQRKRKENMTFIIQGFAAGLVLVFGLQFAYRKLNVDPVQAELARIASENKARDVENQFIPTKTDDYYDTYLDATLYTRRFTDIYLDRNNQQEWVNYATKYFLRQWKVEEEKVIAVISSSNALVQNVVETMPNLKKTKIKTDLAKLKELEDQTIAKNAELLGSNVRYEAYKKLEKEFFNSKLQGRKPAAQ